MTDLHPTAVIIGTAGHVDHGKSTLADRMIEMAMVRQGNSEMAATHRRTLSEQLVPDEADLWQDSPETEWPPPGHDAIAMP